MVPHARIPLHPAPAGASIAFERIERTLEEVRNSVHRHDYSEIFVFATGSGTHMIDLQQHRIVPPCVHAVRAGQVHHLVRSADMEGFVFEFKPDALQDSGRHADARTIFHAMARKPGLPLTPERSAVLADLARMLEGELAEVNGGQQQVLASYLGIALAKCARWWSELIPDENAVEALHTDLLERFRTLVDVHFMEIQQVRDYADKLHVTAGHLNDVVRARLGATAGALIDERLQLEAKRLLLHSEVSVKEAGFAIGMKDPAYFTRWFKRMEGVSPVDYRNSIRDKYK